MVTRLTAACVLLLVGGCKGSSGGVVVTPAERALSNWLECIECDRGEFDSVRAHGTLRDTLIVLFRGGPPAARRQELRQRLAGPYRLIAARQASVSATMLADSAAYTNLYLDLLSNRYLARSALALAAIGGVPGRQALQQAVNDSAHYPVALRPTIRRARDSASTRFP